MNHVFGILTTVNLLLPHPVCLFTDKPLPEHVIHGIRCSIKWKFILKKNVYTKERKAQYKCWAFSMVCV